MSQLERVTGRGGNLRASGFKKKFDDDDRDEEASLAPLEVEEATSPTREEPEMKLNDLINESDSSDEDDSNQFKL